MTRHHTRGSISTLKLEYIMEMHFHYLSPPCIIKHEGETIVSPCLSSRKKVAVHYCVCKALGNCKAEMSLLVNIISISYLAFPSLFSLTDLGG